MRCSKAPVDLHGLKFVFYNRKCLFEISIDLKKISKTMEYSQFPVNILQEPKISLLFQRSVKGVSYRR